MKIFSLVLIISFIFLISAITFSHNFILANECINYDKTTKTIDVLCGSFNLTQLKQDLTSDVLSSDGKTWILSANLQIGDGATIFINATDVDWLKIIGDSENEFYGIINHGTLLIDNTKVSSWNLQTNDYVLQEDSGTIKRPYITSMRSQGSMNVTDSEISYLGFHHSPEQGLSYHYINKSKIDGNNIHNLWYGFYTDDSNNIDITNNHFHNNFKYGIDPHTGSYRLLIQNNTVHDTKLGIGIICSLDCYNITIENNTVYNNRDAGIMFSKNMTNSTVNNNIIHHESQAISLSDSFNNKIYGNVINESQTGIYIKLLEPQKYSSNFENYIFNNTITNSYVGIRIDSGINKNHIHNNKIANSELAGVLIKNLTNTNNEIYENLFSGNKYAIYISSQNNPSENNFVAGVPLWCENEISYSNLNGFQYLLYSNEINSSEPITKTTLFPAWIKNNVCWWSEGLISDEEFEHGIDYLINKKVIEVKP